MALVLWPAPKFVHPLGATTRAAAVPASEFGGASAQFWTRDGIVLRGTRFAPRVAASATRSAATILFLHGVMSNSADYLATCNELQRLTGAEVIALDLRGHGQSDGIPGDIRYIGQYEDDVADVMLSVKHENPLNLVILPGHSMGGGIVMRYAALHLKPEADGYLLFAPHLGVKSPTMRMEPASKGASPEDPFMKLDLPRIIGLALLNGLHIRGFNGLNTLFFNVPAQWPIHQYSFPAMVSMSPDDHLAALTADTMPLLILVGSKDEAHPTPIVSAQLSRYISMVRLS